MNENKEVRVNPNTDYLIERLQAHRLMDQIGDRQNVEVLFDFSEVRIMGPSFASELLVHEPIFGVFKFTGLSAAQSEIIDEVREELKADNSS